jgi:hypothetical protein
MSIGHNDLGVANVPRSLTKFELTHVICDNALF